MGGGIPTCRFANWAKAQEYCGVGWEQDLSWGSNGSQWFILQELRVLRYLAIIGNWSASSTLSTTRVVKKSSTLCKQLPGTTYSSIQWIFHQEGNASFMIVASSARESETTSFLGASMKRTGNQVYLWERLPSWAYYTYCRAGNG